MITHLLLVNSTYLLYTKILSNNPWEKRKLDKAEEKKSEKRLACMDSSKCPNIPPSPAKFNKNEKKGESEKEKIFFPPYFLPIFLRGMKTLERIVESVYTCVSHPAFIM